jgi:methylmalonyl-CoA mutase cobalamin-binding domain/chain
MELLHKQGQDKVAVVIGGIIPEEDVTTLTTMGVRAVYGPGTSTQTIAQDIQGFIQN